MLRKRSSPILTIRALSKVSSSPLFFNHSSHNGYTPPHPLGSDILVSTYLRKNLTRVYNKGQNRTGFFVKCPFFLEKNYLGRVKLLNLLRYYRANSIEEAFELNANRNYNENSILNKSHNHGEVQQFNYFNGGNDLGEFGQSNLNGGYAKNPDGYQKSNIGYTQNRAQMQSPGNPAQLPQYHARGQAFQQNTNASNGFYQVHEFQQKPNAHFGVSQGEAYYGDNGENLPSAGPQSFSQLPIEYYETAGAKLHDGDIGGYKGTIFEFDECCKKGEVKEAVEVLALLKKNGVPVDLQRYLMLVQACAEAGSVEEARAVHNHISEAMTEVGVAVNNKLLDMYCKCGSMADAFQLFEIMTQRNLTSWDTMINGLANNNQGEEAIDLFTEFKEKGLQPDGGLFISVFNACGVLGAVDEGMLHLESMKVDFGITPTMTHYVSIVDMFGKSGYLDEALEFVEKMPVKPSVDVWESLMNLCRVNGYSELGNRCAEIVERLDSSRLTEQTKMGLLPVAASDSGKRRKNNSNPFEFKRHTHELRAGDRSHPENDRIYAQLRALLPNLRDVGYIPNTKPVLHDVDEEAREEAIMAHSEKLAAAYCLLTSPARSPMRILKNLRFCPDCHEAMKIISKVTGRFIICRDAKRFHHFEKGVCSCKDFY